MDFISILLPNKKAFIKSIKALYFNIKARRRPTLPERKHSSTIGDAVLNFRVRDGNGCCPCSIAGGR